MTRRLSFFGVFVLLMCMFGIVLNTHAEDADAPKGKILFTKMEGDSSKLYVIQADGTGLKAVSTTSKMNLYAAWSPDGKTIAYTGFESLQTNPDVYTVSEDGSNERRLTSGSEFSIIPAWSPDGKQILYTSRKGDGGEMFALRLANVDGSVAMDFSLADGLNFFGFWSPDGKRIGYTHGDQKGLEGGGSIHIMDRNGNGSEVVVQANGLNVCGQGAWSPDGKSLAVCRLDPATENASLWLIDLKTKSEAKIADIASTKLAEPVIPTAAWSPDGKWIACPKFDSEKKGRIILFSPDGKTQKPVTGDADNCFAPSWAG